MGWNDHVRRSIHHFQELTKWNVDILQKENHKGGHQAFEQRKCPTPYSIIKSFVMPYGNQDPTFNFFKNNYVYILLHVIGHYQFSKMFGVMSMWGGPIKGLLDTTGESSYRWHGYKNYEQICEPWTLDVLLA